MSRKEKYRNTIRSSEATKLLERCPYCGRKPIMFADHPVPCWPLNWYLPRCSDNHCFETHKQPVMPSTGLNFTYNIREAVRYWNVWALRVRLVNLLQKHLQDKIGTC